MHRQGQGANALGVRRQGLAHHHQQTQQRRPLRGLTRRHWRHGSTASILHAKALPGNPYDGHTLKEVIEETQALTGRAIERVYVDKGYVGHDAPKPLRVFRSGQRRGVHGQIKRELRRRSAIEAVIGHCKTDGHLDRNFLKGRLGDQINAVMSAVGYNLRLILKWLRKLLREIIATLWAAVTPKSTLNEAY